MGWAVQPGERTVQGELEAALATVLRAPVSLTVAGRTDRGVHALGQVCSYEGPLPPLRSLNAVLPRAIAVLAAEAMPSGFSARHDARSRAYVYRLLARAAPSPFELGRALWWPHRAGGGGAARLRGAAAPGRTTSPPSRPPTPTTSASSATCSAPAGSAPATCSSSTSRPTRSCAT